MENFLQVDLTEIGGKGVSVASLLHLCIKIASANLREWSASRTIAL